MQIGTQMYAPDGYRSLAKGTVYHFMFNDATRCRVLFVTFGGKVSLAQREAASPKQATLVYLRRDHFEDGLQRELLLPVESPAQLPPWFGEMTIADLRNLHGMDVNEADRHGARVDAILLHLWPAISKLSTILASERPERALNGFANECCPAQNLKRFRTAFFAYVAFGMNRWALHFAVQKIGRWDRSNRDTKFGRPSIAFGPLNGHNGSLPEVREKVIDGYRKFSGKGVHLKKIYRQTMVSIFGCTVGRISGIPSFLHPEGAAFPSERQFAYIVGLHFPLHDRQYLKYGFARTRNRLMHSQGRYMESVGNLMERVEADAYMVEERSEGSHKKSLLPSLYVVRVICVTSGFLTGIGFSLGSERAAAYRMAKACQAVDKVWFCSLFGISITPDEWPSIGLSMHDIVDRGPGASAGAHAISSEFHPIIRELAPSHAGQSKATIETSHPKSVKQEGAPEYEVTRITIPQLAAREIHRLIADNKTRNISDRLNPSAISAQVLPTPLHLWNHLSALGRSLAVSYPRDEVIRKLFTPVDVTLRDGAVYFLDMRFSSAQLQDSGVFTSVGKSETVRAFIIDVCLRHIFIDTPSGMLILDVMHTIRDADEQRYYSVVELEALADLRARGRATMRLHQGAAIADHEMRFEEEFGIPFSQKTRRKGRAKKNNCESLEEKSEVMPYMGVAKTGRR